MLVLIYHLWHDLLPCEKKIHTPSVCKLLSRLTFELYLIIRLIQNIYLNT
jgi:hypothetical protein